MDDPALAERIRPIHGIRHPRRCHVRRQHRRSGRCPRRRVGAGDGAGGRPRAPVRSTEAGSLEAFRDLPCPAFCPGST
jgi:hypothetical protein